MNNALNKPHENRIGKFYISGHEIDINWQALLPVMANFVIVRCEFLFYSHKAEYIAYSPLFDVNPEGSVPPEYSIQITLVGGETVVTARKV